MRKLSLMIFLFFLFINLYCWQSPNEGNSYTIEYLSAINDSITYVEADNRYEIICDLIIMEADTLIINSGMEIKLYSRFGASEGIKVLGTLLALGTEDSPIILGDVDADLWSGEMWSGISFYNTSTIGESIIKFCTIIGASAPFKETFIYCENSSPIIDHCTFKIMWSGAETGGAAAIYCGGTSYPVISYCTFQEMNVTIAIWCGNIGDLNPDNGYWGEQDTLNYPNPLIFGCNIMPSVGSFWGFGCNYDIVVLNGGFLDNCYLGISSNEADTSLGVPPDLVGDGICNTISTIDYPKKFWMVDGVVNPRSIPELTNIESNEINILPTTTKYLELSNNYPNPFLSSYSRGSTSIEFAINNESVRISLEIFNSKGQLVKTLVDDEIFAKGKHQTTWFGDNKNGDKVSSGVYFYKLSSNTEMLVKKAIVVK